MEQIIVTDVTHFKDEHLCVAGLTMSGMRCVRPLKSRSLSANHPYLTHAECRALGIRPGAVVEGDFVPAPDVHRPHIEDCIYHNISCLAAFDQASLSSALEASSIASVSEGFEVTINEKYIPINSATPARSIITLRPQPNTVELTVGYGKLKIHFVDFTGTRYNWIPVTDVGLSDHILSSPQPAVVARKFTNLLARQIDIFLRVGIGRPYATPDGRHGYWLQVNSILTLPHTLDEFRRY
jgi:hypothetical protein